MRHRYLLPVQFILMTITALFLTSCSENEEDIAAPSISIIQPAANDTIALSNGYLIIKVIARDKVNIDDMRMTVQDESGNIFYSYTEDDINEQSYTCTEIFYPTGINKKTRLTLCATAENEFKNWGSGTINFYVKP
jgi:hypothetical protein